MQQISLGSYTNLSLSEFIKMEEKINVHADNNILYRIMSNHIISTEIYEYCKSKGYVMYYNKLFLHVITNNDIDFAEHIILYNCNHLEYLENLRLMLGLLNDPLHIEKNTYKYLLSVYLGDV